MVTIDEQINLRKLRWLDFYNPNLPKRHVFVIRYAPALPTRPIPNPWLKQERLEWIAANFTWHLERMQWLEDDTIPSLDMLTGTEIFAEAFGCPVHYPQDNMPFALPIVQSAEEADRLKLPSIDCPPMKLVFDMADELIRRFGKAAILRMVDLQSPMDVAALIWEKRNFYTALLDYPDTVLTLVEKIKTLQYNFLDEWFRRYGKEFIAHYPEYYMPSGVTMSVDEIGVVSSRMFNKFFLPELVEHSNRYGGIGIHCCASARHQWDNFKKVPGLRLLNINQPQELAREAVNFFAGHVPLWMVGWEPTTEDPQAWAQQLPENARMVFDVTVENKDEALRISERLLRICRE